MTTLATLQILGAPDDEERIRLTNHHAALWGLLYAEWIQRDIGTIGEYAPRPEVAPRGPGRGDGVGFEARPGV